MALLELDVALTKDGQPVIFHDATLERLCGPEYKNKTIRDYDFNDLPPLSLLLQYEEVRAKREVVNDPESTRIPLLETLLKEFPHYPMQIDVKVSWILRVPAA